MLAEKVLAGDGRAAARLMRDLDDRIPSAIDELRALHPHTGRAFVLGVTGNPGAGKSTVVDALIERYRKRGKRVGVVAVDPTSPFSGGAILGDRIRMQRHATDDGVFIRSLATRGHLGGLSRSTGDVVAVLDAMGFDVVIIETVGVGQDEVEIVSTAHTAVVVTVPGLGDDIQAIKAGILEIADVLVVNKADREGADRTVRDLTHMLDLRAGEPVEIVKTTATTGQGIDELVAAIDRHRQKDDGSRRARDRAAAQLLDLVRDRLNHAAQAALSARGGLAALAEDIAARRRDPYSVADEVVAAAKLV
ncbi:MAG TPA: methylmalonyl Co-A mutase-associated GTPase MeaB [Haliangiales bacterium]|nr:methylmalonyl Co-A mutase-associated GTPase MeaB [Haliangiales bacterium]